MKFKVGAKVQWMWLGRVIQGVVKEIYTEPIFKEIKGKNIKRNGSKENPAYVVESSAGNLALKLQTELQKSGTKRSSKPTPSLFGDD